MMDIKYKPNAKANIWKCLKLTMFMAVIYLLAIANASSEDVLEFKEDLDVNANVIHVADLNNDGKNEVLLGTVKIDNFDYVYIYQHTKSGYRKAWTHKIPEDGNWGGVTSITTGDSDNDGQLELIVSTGQPSDSQGDSSLRVFDREDNKSLNFEVVYTYELRQRTEPGSIEVGDTDNDGKNEIVVGLSWYSGKIIKFKHQETGEYKTETIQNTGSDVKSISIADLDDDGTDEIVAGTSCWKEYDVRILEYTGVYKNVWRKSIGYTLATTGNLDNDDAPEILAVSGAHCGNVDTPKPKAWIFECTSRFNDYSRYGEVWNETFKAGESFGQGGCSPVIGDLVGNETNEFVFPMSINRTHEKILVYGFSDGEYKQLQTIGITPSDLFIGDSDNNGVDELLICDNYDRRVKIYEGPGDIQKDDDNSEMVNKKNSLGSSDSGEGASSLSFITGFEALLAITGICIALIARKLK